MNLILDTSTENLVVILEEKGKICSSNCDVHVKHQEFLLPEIEKILVQNGKSLKDVTCIGVVVGPGSFTGVRLAVATAKAFCFVYKKIKLVAINMLDLLDFVVDKNHIDNYACFIKCTATKNYVLSRDGEKCDKFILENNKIDELKEKSVYALNMDKVGEINANKIVLTAKDYVDYFMKKVDEKDFDDYKTVQIAYMALSQAEENLKNGGNS